MAQSFTTDPAGGAAQRQELLATKFHVPNAGVVPRPRLVKSLARIIGGGLTLVCTPAGFGKSTLLGDFARQSRRPTAWVSLDDGENDPSRFWRYVAAALDGVRPGIAEQVAPLLLGPEVPPLDVVVTVLINDVSAMPSGAQIVLILDDFHLIKAQPVLDSVALLLHRLPPGLRLALATRTDPPLPLARLRASGQVAELRSADLRFTLEETAALLGETTGLHIPASAIAGLHDRTDGWAVGVQLASLSLREHPDPDDFVQTFCGSHRYVLDYLTEEVLARQTNEVVGFLLETSVLDRLCGPLCDALTGRTDGQEVLEGLDAAGLFLIPLDEERRWWRYHHLFADLLRVRLQHERGERVQGLHRAAAAWHEEHGFPDEAVRHATAAGDVVWAARLIELNVEGLLRRSEGATLGRWLSTLPAETLRARPRLCLARAVSAAVESDTNKLDSLLADAEVAFATVGDERHKPSVERHLSVLTNIPAAISFLRADLARLRGDAVAAVASDEVALGYLSEDDWLLGSHVRWNLGVAEWLRGHLGRAERVLAGVFAERRAAGEGYLSMRVGYDLGQVQRARGRLGAAFDTYRLGLLTASESGCELPAAGMAHVGLATLLYERGELDAARDHAVKAVALSRHLAFTQPMATGLAMLAWIRQAQGDASGALDAMDQAQGVGVSPDVVALMNPVPALRARLQLTRGEIDDAVRWVQERGVGIDDQPAYPMELDYLVLGRLLLAQQKPDQALRLLRSLRGRAVIQRRTHSVIELQSLEALALAAGGDERAALETLAEAVGLALPLGYVRVFVDEGTPMARLVGELASVHRTSRIEVPGEVSADDLERLQGAFRAESPTKGRSDRTDEAGHGVIEPLTDREMQVLGLMASGKSNQEIADELVVVLDTVKKHVGHILDKLGAANRTQAVARARVVGLLR
jgi:LuxR family transcriptional regulator, maltose regulon positive regulatory protein